MSEVTAEKKYREELFEEELDNIHIMAELKIQLINENMRHTERYRDKMLHRVDRFEDKIYDSSYIVWVPVIQQRLRPWAKRFKEKKMQLEQDN